MMPHSFLRRLSQAMVQRVDPGVVTLLYAHKESESCDAVLIWLEPRQALTLRAPRMRNSRQGIMFCSGDGRAR